MFVHRVREGLDCQHDRILTLDFTFLIPFPLFQCWQPLGINGKLKNQHWKKGTGTKKGKSNVNILSCGAVTTCSVCNFAHTRKPFRSKEVESEAMSFSRLARFARGQICAFCEAGWTRPQIAARVRKSDNTPCPVKTVHIRICTFMFY